MDFMKLKASLSLDSGEYEKGLGNAEGKAKGFGGKFKTAMVVAGTAVASATAAVGALVKKSIDAYGEFEQLSGGAELLFGDAFKFIENRAANAYANVQMSQNDYLRQVNGFAVGLKTALGGNEDAAARLADKIITAEADIVAATGNTQENVQNAFNGVMKGNYTMLDNLQIGITPTKAGMQEVIDKVNEWNAAQGKASNYTIDNMADVQSALIDYIDMQGLSGYAAEEASGTIQGSLASVKAAWENLMVGFANPDANMTELVQNLVESVGTAAANLGPAVLQAIEGIANAFNTILPELLSNLPNIIQTYGVPLIQAGASLVANLISGLTQAAPGLISMAFKLVGDLLMGIANALPNVLIMGINLITSIIEGFTQGSGDLIARLGEILTALGTAIVDALPELGAAMLNLAKALGDFFLKTNWLSIGLKAFKGIWNAIKQVAPLVRSVVMTMVRGVIGYLGFAGAAAKAKTAFENIRKAIADKIDAAKQKVKDVIQGIKDLFPFSVGKIFKGWIPKPKLTVSHSSDGSASSSTSVGRDDFAKAMNRPYLFRKETLVNQYAGHAWGGGEIMYGKNNLMSDIKEAVGGGNGDININLNYDANADATDMLRDLARGVKRYRMAGAF